MKVRRSVATGILLLVFFALIPPLYAQDDPENLLKNASFEIPLDPDNWPCDQPAQWIRWGNWFNRETGWKPTHSGECMIGFHHFRLRGDDNAGIYQDVRDAQKNIPHTFSVFAWIDKDVNAENIQLRLDSFHGGSVITTSVFRINKLSRDQWVPLSVSGVSPDDGMRAMIVVTPKERAQFPKGAIKFDDARFNIKATEDNSQANNSRRSKS